MNLLRLSPTAFAWGAAGLVAALLVLHLLRVRLRRQTVDSLLFFQMLGEVRRPRVLPGRPARWLAFLLALLATLAGLTALADPWFADPAPSRLVVVDATARSRAVTTDGRPLLTASLDLAADLVAAHGLGPNGRVVAVGADEVTLLRAGEPQVLLRERSAALVPSGAPAAVAARIAAHAADDEVWLIGGPMEPPPTASGRTPRRFAADAASIGGLVAASVDEATATTLRVTAAAPAGGPVELRGADGTTLATATLVATGTTSLTTATLELPAGAIEGTLAIESSAPVPIRIPARVPLPIHVAPDAPAAVARVVAADPRLRAAGTDEAVVVVGSEVATANGTARVRILGGVAPGLRRPRATADCPIELALRDRSGPTRTALPPLDATTAADATVWIEDAVSGAPLVDARRDGGALEIRIVSWLLEPASHRNVPTLLAGALRLAAGVGPIGPLPTGVRADVPAATAGLVEIDGDVAFATDGHVALPARAGEIATVAVPGDADAAATETDAGDDRGGPTPWVAFLLGAALLWVAIDAWLFAKGRIP